MNLVGKIFTVLIFVLCLVWMSFSVMLYATQKNWQLVVDNPTDSTEHPLGLKQQLTEQIKLKELKIAENKQVNDDLKATQQAETEVRAKLETEKALRQQEEKDDALKIQALDSKARDAIAALKVAHETLANLRAERDALVKDIDAAHSDRDKTFKELVAKTDELHQTVNELTQLRERGLALAADLAAVKEAARYFGIDYKGDYKSKQPPAGVNGIVLAVPEPNVVEISIGSDDGLRKGHKLEVMRVASGVSSYVGRIEVVQTTPDKAVCRVIPEMLRLPVQRGDRVYDKLNN